MTNSYSVHRLKVDDMEQSPAKTSQEALAAGKAALTLCESILLFLVEKGLAQADDVVQLVEDAVYLHRQEAVDTPAEEPVQQLAAGFIEKIIRGRNIT